MMRASYSAAPSPESGTPSAGLAPVPRPRLHLTYLDGLRGLAAFYVLLHHLYMKVLIDAGVAPIGFPLAAFGELAVDVFIVLSGYCLMLPIVRSASAEISGGAWTFFKRRAWRILPPYFAALSISMGMLWVSHRLSLHHGMLTTTKVSGLSLGPILSHLLLVHNLKPAWAFQIDGSLWSVATEWQIYFFLPALLLPLWKRWGPVPMLACAWGLGLLPWFLHLGLAESARTWLLGLFALGMAAAGINFPRQPQEWVRRVPWGGITLCLTFFLLVIVTLRWETVAVAKPWPVDLLMGLLTATLLIHCTSFRAHQEARAVPLVLRLLESRFMVGLGAFSYSLYLIHGPILAVLIALTRHRLDANQLTLFMLVVGVPVTCAVSFLFYLLFERPVLHIRAVQSRRQREVTL